MVVAVVLRPRVGPVARGAWRSGWGRAGLQVAVDVWVTAVSADCLPEIAENPGPAAAAVVEDLLAIAAASPGKCTAVAVVARLRLLLLLPPLRILDFQPDPPNLRPVCTALSLHSNVLPTSYITVHFRWMLQAARPAKKFKVLTQETTAETSQCRKPDRSRQNRHS